MEYRIESGESDKLHHFSQTNTWSGGEDHYSSHHKKVRPVLLIFDRRMQLSDFQGDLFLFLFAAAVAHSFYLATLLLLKSQKERGLGWLGILMIPISMWLLNYLLYISDVIHAAPHLLGVTAPVLYLIGPMIYFFVRRTSDVDHRFQWYDLLHLLPFVYVLWEWLPIYGWDAETKLNMIERVLSPERPPFSSMVRANRHIYLILAYLVAAAFFLKNRVKHAPEESARLWWLQNFTLAFGGLLLAKLLVMSLFFVFKWNGAIMELILVLIITAAIHVLGYVILGKDRVLPERMRPAPGVKYATSPLNTLQIANHKEQVMTYLTQEQPWLNPDFSINQIARSLNIPRHHVSQVFSEGLQKSFSDLIAELRIDEVKKRLLAGDQAQFSLLGIATNCGFGSKSSFNRAFKKVIGMTPTAWLKSVNGTSIPNVKVD